MSKTIGKRRIKSKTNELKLACLRFVKNEARQIVKKGFNISENCILIPKISIHRIAPLLSTPTKNKTRSKTIEIQYIAGEYNCIAL